MPTCLRLFLILFLFASCGRDSRPEFDFDPGEVVATVDGSPIHSELFEETYVNFLSRTGFNDTPEQRYRHLNIMIDTWLMAGEAERRNMNDTLYQDYRHKTTQRSLRNRFLKHNFSTSIDDITDPEVRLAFYRTHQKPYVSQLFFTDPARAQAYYERLEAGEAFRDLANELYMTVEYDSLAGFMGEISYFGVDDAFAEAAFRLNAGDYSEPVRTRQGYVIIRVDNWNFNPLVTETQYLSRKEKIRFFSYQRNYNLGADAFVRSYMAALNPEPLRDNLQQVYRMIQRYLPPADQARPRTDFMDQPLLRGDQKVLLDELDPLLPLVTYTIEGELQAFRLQDYVMWMEFLPYLEVTGRFDASIGRALMWNVFAKQAVAQGLDRDPFIAFNADAASRFFQASRLTDSLRAAPVPAIPDEEIETAFELLGMGTLARNTTTFWSIRTRSFEEARSLRDSLSRQPEPTQAPRGAARFTRADVYETAPDIAGLLMKAPPGQVMLAGTDTGWYVFQVLERDAETFTPEERRQEVIERLKPAYNEFQLLRELRRSADIRIDTAAFAKLMAYYPQQPVTQ